MSYTIPYYSLESQDDRQIEASKPKMTGLLRYSSQVQDSKQAIKRRFNIFHKISIESQDFSHPFTPSEIRRLTIHFKRLRYLPCLGIDINSLPLQHKVLRRFFESLKHTKYLSEIHFYFTNPWMHYSNGLVLISCQALRSFCVLPRRKIKLSFPFSYSSSHQTEHKFLKSFTKQKYFTSAHGTFRIGCKISEIQEVITTLSHSKSLTELSLTLNGIDFTSDDPARLPHDLFRSLKEMKTIKNCRVFFKECLIDDSTLEGLIPALKEAAQVLNLEIIFQEIGRHALVTWFGWWWFRMSVRNLSPSHTAHAKFIGDLDAFSAKQWIACYLIVFLFVLFILALLCFFS